MGTVYNHTNLKFKVTIRSSSSSSVSSSSESFSQSSSSSSSSLSSSSVSSSSISSSSSGIPAAWNPSASNLSLTFSDNDRIVTAPLGTPFIVYGNKSFNSGKKYYEIYCVDGASDMRTGWGASGYALDERVGTDATPPTLGWNIETTQINIAGGFQFFNTVAPEGNIDAGDVIMMAVDLDNGEYYWGVNGSWFTTGTGVQNPSAGVNPISYAGLASENVYPICSFAGNASISGSFDYGDFAYTPPSGFLPI